MPCPLTTLCCPTDRADEVVPAERSDHVRNLARQEADAPSDIAGYRRTMLVPSLLVTALLAAAPPASGSENGPSALDAAGAVAILEALAGTDARLFPSTLTVTAVDVEGARGQVVAVLMGLPAGRDEVLDELRRETILGALSAANVDGGVTLLVGDSDDVRPLGAPATEYTKHGAPPRRRPVDPSGASTKDPGRSGNLPFGAPLLGMRIAISPGHGWLDNGGGNFGTQRSNHKFGGCGNCRGIVEDFFSSETVMDQIVPLLQGMGATVLLVREGDHTIGDDASGDPVIVDDGDALYSEPEGTWTDGTTAGVGYLDDYRVNAEDSPGRAVFTVPPLSRPTRVTLRFPEGANRTAAAIVSIVHEGGVRTIDIDQREMGRQWLDLGVFPFGSGGAVEVAHGPSTGFLMADAIKAGGGVHPASRKPWWEMAAKSFVPEQAGAPSNVTANGDVTIRPFYAETLDPDVYVSIHANASGAGAGSTAHGTSTYRYSCSTFGDHSSSDGAASCDDPSNSQALLDEVHASVMAELRAKWDPGWADRGRLVANFGELRELDDTPGILVETGFFDNLTTPDGVIVSDNQALHDPRWREAFAVGVVRGLARFLAPGSDAPPARPDGVVAVNASDGTLRISWSPVAAADGYRVLRSNLATTRGRGFDEGKVVTGVTELVLDVTALTPGDAYAFRVVAANENGEGYPSQAVVARFRGTPGAEAPVLVVGAYDRKDAFVQTVDNDDMAVIEHGIGLKDTAIFDGALDEALEAGAVSLQGRRLVDVVVGKESVEHAPISDAMRALLEGFLDEGGAVVLSGEEVGYAMIEVAEAAAATDAAAFFLERFGAVYVSDDAETFELVGTGLFAGVRGFADSAPRLDDGTSLYEVVFPDVWQVDALNALATAPLTYPDGSAAAIVTDQTALFGAGLEAIDDDVARAAIFAALVAHLVPGLPAEGEGEGEGEPGEGEGEPGEGEGEGELGVQSVPPSVDPGCGCSASSTPDTRPLVALVLALLAVRARRPRSRASA